MVIAIFITLSPIFRFFASLYPIFFVAGFSLTWFLVDSLLGKGYFKCYFVVWLIASVFVSPLPMLGLYWWIRGHTDVFVFVCFMVPIVIQWLYTKLFDKVKNVEAKTKKVEKRLEK